MDRVDKKSGHYFILRNKQSKPFQPHYYKKML